jgi:hypothetical protein
MVIVAFERISMQAHLILLQYLLTIFVHDIERRGNYYRNVNKCIGIIVDAVSVQLYKFCGEFGR